MNHAYIEENSVIERYHGGRLPAEEEALFEEHFVDCSQCIEQLELARDFRRGLQVVAAQDAMGIQAVASLAWWARLGRWSRAGLVATTLIAFGALSAWLGGALLSGGPSLLDGQQPRADIPVFVISATRAAPEATELSLGAAGDLFQLAIGVHYDPRFASYRVTLSESGGAEIWRRADLQVNDLETLLITFPKGFLAIGDYRLEVQGVFADGASEALGDHRLRVIP